MILDGQWGSKVEMIISVDCTVK